MIGSRKSLRCVVGLLLCGVFAGLTAPRAAQAQAGEQVWELQVANMHSLYGVDVILTYDAAVVEVIDADPDRPGVQIQPGSLFTSQPYFVVYNRVTVNQRTGVGTISFVATLLNPADPINGGGVVASIRYRVEESSGPMESPFTIQEVRLASLGGRRMLAEWEGNVIRQVFRIYLPLLAAYPSYHPPPAQPARGAASGLGRQGGPAAGFDWLWRRAYQPR